MTTLHLMTQRDQPYGSRRKCCERCGLMMVYRPDSFWKKHTWTDEPDHYKRWPAGSTLGSDELIPCRTDDETPNGVLSRAAENPDTAME